MSSSFHLQTDGQTERVNQSLETYLQHFVSVGLNDWDTLSSRAEFAHNAAVHETVRAAPFKSIYGYIPRTLVGEVVEFVHPASAAFVERLQSSLSFARKCLIAAQQR
jgi:L-serine deaminase